MTDNLPQLRDIHLPDYDVSAWPPAAGWYWLLLLMVTTFIGYKVVMWLRRKSAKLYAKYLLNKILSDDIAGAVQMSELLRRICVHRYPKAVAYSGQQWIDFLNSKTKQKLAPKTALLLQNAPYIQADSQVYTMPDVRRLRQFCLNWIGENL